MAKKKSAAKNNLPKVEPEPKGPGGARPGAGRKPSGGPSQIQPQVQIGRHSQDDIDLIDRAASIAGETRSSWTWPILMREAKKVIKKAETQ